MEWDADSRGHGRAPALAAPEALLCAVVQHLMHRVAASTRHQSPLPALLTPRAHILCRPCERGLHRLPQRARRARHVLARVAAAQGHEHGDELGARRNQEAHGAAVERGAGHIDGEAEAGAV